MKKGYFCLAFCILMASTVDIVLKQLSFSVNSLQLGFLRFLGGGLTCLPAAVRRLRKHRIHMDRYDFYYFLLSGLLVVVLSTSLYQIAIALGKASVLAILYCCNPLFMAPVAYILLGERLGKGAALSLLFYAFGIGAIFAGQLRDASVLSSVLVLMATTFFAVYSALGQYRIERYPPIVYISLSFLTGSAEMLLLILTSHLPGVIAVLNGVGLGIAADIPLFGGVSFKMIPALLYLAIVQTGLNLLSLQVVTAEFSANSSTVIYYFKLIFAPLLAWYFLKESITVYMWCGMACIFIGLMIRTRYSPGRAGKGASAG